MTKNDDYKKIEWLLFKSINSWTGAVKGELIYLGMLIDTPGNISTCSVIGVSKYLSLILATLCGSRRLTVLLYAATNLDINTAI